MRPTTGKVMQALFNILGPLNGNSFLDLFSGSGQIALNAYKRGADPVSLV
ncbi:MAG: RsmD family RNA methyltransferase, partial [Synergistaceae bacterium]